MVWSRDTKIGTLYSSYFRTYGMVSVSLNIMTDNFPIISGEEKSSENVGAETWVDDIKVEMEG